MNRIRNKSAHPSLAIVRVDLHARETAPAALTLLRSLLAEYDAALPADLRLVDLQSELQALPERYAAPDAAFFVARAAEEAVGCVAVRLVDETTAEIKRLYVVPAARRSGAGRALVEAALAFGRKRSCVRAVLDTERDRVNTAYELYRSLGFAECAPYAQAEYANPTFMEKRL